MKATAAQSPRLVCLEPPPFLPALGSARLASLFTGEWARRAHLAFQAVEVKYLQLMHLAITRGDSDAAPNTQELVRMPVEDHLRREKGQPSGNLEMLSRTL